jgi:hypothetical protein
MPFLIFSVAVHHFDPGLGRRRYREAAGGDTQIDASCLTPRRRPRIALWEVRTPPILGPHYWWSAHRRMQRNGPIDLAASLPTPTRGGPYG